MTQVVRLSWLVGSTIRRGITLATLWIAVMFFDSLTRLVKQHRVLFHTRSFDIVGADSKHQTISVLPYKNLLLETIYSVAQPIEECFLDLLHQTLVLSKVELLSLD